MKLNMRQRLKVLATGSIDDYTKSFYNGDDLGTDAYVDATLAMKYSAVNACVRVRAETFASVPFLMYQKNKDGREVIEDDMLYEILHYQPNNEMSPFSFKEVNMTNFDVGGNIVCERLINKSGALVGLYPYNYSAVRIERKDGVLMYGITNGTNIKWLKREQVFHVPNMSFDGVNGLSPISYAAEAIRLGLSYEKFGANFYKNGAMTSGTFEHPAALSKDAYERLKNDLHKNYIGLKNAGYPMILEEGMKFSPMSINPVDAQLLESKYFQIEDIARIYRVPQHLINKLDRSTFNNIEQLSLEFVMFTMLPIFKRYEDCMNMQLVGLEKRRKGFYIEAKIDGLLRGDAKSRAEAYSIGRLGGWLSANDVRRMENQPSIANGDIYLQPLNYVEAGTQEVIKQIYNEVGKIVEKGGKA